MNKSSKNRNCFCVYSLWIGKLSKTETDPTLYYKIRIKNATKDKFGVRTRVRTEIQINVTKSEREGEFLIKKHFKTLDNAAVTR